MITRIVCSRTSSKPHQLGHIAADPAGLVLTYRQAVMTASSDPDGVLSPQDGFHYRRDGADAELREPTDAVLTIDLWCKSCKTGHPVDARELFGAAKRRRRNVQLTSRGAWEGLWK